MAHLHPSSARHSLAELAVCGLRLMSELYKNPSKSGKDPQPAGDRDAGVGQVGSSSNDDSRLPMATLRLPLLAFG